MQIRFKWKTDVPLLAVLGALLIWILMNASATPEARIADYLHAVERGNRQQALGIWNKMPAQAWAETATRLDERREQITDRLLAEGVQANVEIIRSEGWRTCCCEPSRTRNPNEADLVRILVRLTLASGAQPAYFFDLRRQRQGCENSPFQLTTWVMTDAYPLGERPVYFAFGLHESIARFSTMEQLFHTPTPEPTRFPLPTPGPQPSPLPSTLLGPPIAYPDPAHPGVMPYPSPLPTP